MLLVLLSLFVACAPTSDPAALGVVSPKESGPTESAPYDSGDSGPGDSSTDTADSGLDSVLTCGDSGYPCEREGMTLAERTKEEGGGPCGGDAATLLLGLCLGGGMMRRWAR